MSTAAAPIEGAQPGLWRTLRHRDFRLVWLGQAISLVGDQIFPIAVVALVLDTTGPPGLSLILAARAMGGSAFVMIGGVVADRIGRRPTLIGADAVRLVAVAGLALAPGRSPIVVAALLCCVVGAGEAFFRPAYSALLPSLVPEPDLQAANALSAVLVKTATVVGPALAGAVVASAGVSAALWIDVASFAVSIVSLLPVREPALKPRERTSVVRDVREGMEAVRQRPWLLRTLLVGGLQLLTATGPLLVLLPVVAKANYGSGAFGAILSCFGAGALVGAMVAGRLRPVWPGRVALLGLAVIVVPLLSLLGRQPFFVMATAFAVGGLGLEVFNVFWQTALQHDIPRELLARVAALDWLVTFIALPAGLALTGPAYQQVGVTPLVAVAVGVVLVTSPLPLFAPGGSLMRTPARTAR